MGATKTASSGPAPAVRSWESGKPRRRSTSAGAAAASPRSSAASAAKRMEWRRRSLSSASFLQSTKRRHWWARRRRRGGAAPPFRGRARTGSSLFRSSVRFPPPPRLFPRRVRWWRRKATVGASLSHPVGRPPSSQSPKSAGDANPVTASGPPFLPRRLEDPASLPGLA